MAEHLVTFDSLPQTVHVPTGTLLAEAARLAGIEINQPCGGQGRCGRCALLVKAGSVRRRSTLRLSDEDVSLGYALACQTVIEGDITVAVPPQEKIERLLTTDRTVGEVTVPVGYNHEVAQTIRRFSLRMSPPDLGDQTDDWSRLLIALRQQTGIESLRVSLRLLQQVGRVLREGDWEVTAVIDMQTWDSPEGWPRLIDLKPGRDYGGPLWGVAIDIGTTTVSLWLVDLLTGRVEAQTADYNAQIVRGEDVVSRIVFSNKEGGYEQMRSLVLGTINNLVERACKRVKITDMGFGTRGLAQDEPGGKELTLISNQLSQARSCDIVKATVVGNSTMIHLLLGIPADSIRLMPFVTTINEIPALTAEKVGINIHPEASIDCLPGVASYVGADITAGVLSAGVNDTEKVTLFLDVGTNGEIVLGSREWLVTCAASAGPAFEGAGVRDGMRATKGAIEEVWINSTTHEPSFRVIGNVPPRGICGSGLISLLAEMFLTGVVDKAGHINTDLENIRVREGEHGSEYVIAWARESANATATATAAGNDIAITNVDIDNLLRAKAAIYAGFTVLAQSVGIPLEWVEQVLIGGSFGKYINVEKAVLLGLLPDIPWERFQFLGNTAVKGAYLALLDKQARARVKEIAARMTYIELSADNTFYDAFMSALFLPHTDMSKFPSVEAAINKNQLLMNVLN